MEKEEMLKKMCGFGLSQADIKAICNIRNLPPACLKSRELFQHHFLDETGIEKIIASLDEKQILFLHLPQTHRCFGLQKRCDVAKGNQNRHHRSTGPQGWRSEC